MPYVKYNNDPIARRTSQAFTDLCSAVPAKKGLRLVDGCFTVFNGSNKEASFCALQNMLYPVDNQIAINFEVCAGETLSVFDNGLDQILPTYVEPSANYPINYPLGKTDERINVDTTGPSDTPGYYILPNERAYARAVLLYILYPSIDANGDDVLPADNECTLTITNRDLESYSVPLSEFFAHFCNPETRSANSLINKIEITNPNPNFSITVSGLVMYVKSNTDPSDCSC